MAKIKLRGLWYPITVSQLKTKPPYLTPLLRPLWSARTCPDLLNLWLNIPGGLEPLQVLPLVFRFLLITHHNKRVENITMCAVPSNPSLAWARYCVMLSTTTA